MKLRMVYIFVLVALDQTSKYWVEKSLPFQLSEPFIPFLSFYRTYNEGIAFSGLNFIGNNILIVLIMLIICFVIWLWSQLDKGKLLSDIGFTFIISGALGNLIDRFTQGHVIDFIQFHTQNWSFAIFNLADAMITIGAALIILDELKQIFQAKREPDNG